MSQHTKEPWILGTKGMERGKILAHSTHPRSHRRRKAMNYQIPKSEQENFISVYWQMLREIESNTDPKKDILNKHLVDGAYRLLNRAGICDNKPCWSQEKGNE
jgi:hypothetical protein